MNILTKRVKIPMTTNKKMPSLSEDGWVNNSIKTCDYLLSHFFLSDYSQSYIYHGQVSSLPWIIQQTQGNMSRTVSLTQQTLSGYFSRYFNNVVVEVSEIEDANNPSKGEITIYVKFTDAENKEYVVGKLLHITDLTISKIINLSNGA